MTNFKKIFISINLVLFLQNPSFSQAKDFGIKIGVGTCIYNGNHQSYQLNNNQVSIYSTLLEGNIMPTYQGSVYKSYKIEKYFGITFQLGVRNKLITGNIRYELSGSPYNTTADITINNYYLFLDILPHVRFLVFKKDEIQIGAGARLDRLIFNKTKSEQAFYLNNEVVHDYQNYILSPLFTISYLKNVSEKMSFIFTLEYCFDLQHTLGYNTSFYFYNSNNDLYIKTQTLIFSTGLLFK